jgi:hypothetical protein
MTPRYIFGINLVIGLLASLAHIPFVVFAALGSIDPNGIPIALAFAMVVIDVAVVITAISALRKNANRKTPLLFHAAVFGCLALYLAYLVLSVALFGVHSQGNIAFTFGLSTAFCAYAVYLTRLALHQFKQVPVGHYHWYTVAVIGVGEVVMAARFVGAVGA